MKAYLVEVDWPSADQRFFVVYSESEDKAETMAEEKLIDLGDLEVGELGCQDCEAELLVHEIEGAPTPSEELLVWVV